MSCVTFGAEAATVGSPTVQPEDHVHSNAYSPLAADEAPPPGPFVRRATPESLRKLARRVRKVRTPRLSKYAPVSMLEAPDHTPSGACVPAYNFHCHLGRWLNGSGKWMERDVGALIDLMDALNVEAFVNLDGRWGSELEENLDRYDRAHPGRFFSFCHLDWRLLEEPNGDDRLAESLRQSIERGARGLKIWKDLGMSITARGRRILPDDALLSHVWTVAGELGIPVLIHVGDPVAFFTPVDHHNERLEELLRYPKGSRRREGIGEFHHLLDSLEQVVASHPSTQVVAAHGLHVENLSHVSDLLDRYPNLFIDIAGRAAEFGRQPRRARELLIQHSDRVLFGTDVYPVSAGVHQIYFRLLETDDDAFPYSTYPTPPYGRWSIYGLDLPQDVLVKIYRENARDLLRLPSDGTESSAPVEPGIRSEPARSVSQ
jgi:predicted TIM-barrel fold metal-dependent hydrolase